jgi:hypothetical protein
MHMLREQGPPPPFEPNGAPHGSTGMLGPMLGGSAPIIAMPPNFRHDPRRLRRFIPQFLNLFFLMFACFWYSSCYSVAVKGWMLVISFVDELRNGVVLFGDF